MMPIDEFGPLDAEEKRGGLEIEKDGLQDSKDN